MFGGGVTVKGRPLLGDPPTLTTTFPVVAPDGTDVSMLVSLQEVAVAGVPLKVIVLDPCVAPKLEPVIVMLAPIGPCVRLRVEMLGPGLVTVNATPLLNTPPTVTTTLPVIAPLGTVAVMLVALHIVGVAETPLNVTVLDPWLVPKFAPAIVTEVPMAPEFGVTLEMLGGMKTIKFTALLAKLPTVTITLPVEAPAGTGTMMVVAAQFMGVAMVPLKVTVLLPWVEPKFRPEIVTVVPTAPEAGLSPVILGPVPPEPAADLKAATVAPQLSDAPSDALAEIFPATD